MKKIKLNITREEDNLQSNIYYVCEKNILISRLNLTINCDENNIEDDEIVETNKIEINNNSNIDKREKKEKCFNIKISYSDELNNLYLNNVINNLYDYIFESKTNDFNINKNHRWHVFINMYIYEYTPYIYDHICNVINVHLSLLLIPLCFYDFDHKWYRCIKSYEELEKLLSVSSSSNDGKLNEDSSECTHLNGDTLNDHTMNCEFLHKKSEEEGEIPSDILILDKNQQNKKIIINQLENYNFDLFVEIKNDGAEGAGLFKRVLINFIPILRTVNVDDQFVYVIKFVEYHDFLLNTQNIDDYIYNNIIKKYKFSNFTKCTFIDSFRSIKGADKFDLNENYYILYNANNAATDETSILEDSKETIQFYYDFILNYCTGYFTKNFVK
ncbi:hypothetical protein, conserved [Plasmodium gonderi]|uniref:Uncharacterized protein n=1 Tax=Plasmodium gonderi TaxID=77519 RepID=A0A1Y1JGV6_PLAGO|nr:hypothetical protein, conserved [Plasmodium gonderi]GAW81769.1 hypothetical protein, conserved [Plasmodium gonderi]